MSVDAEVHIAFMEKYRAKLEESMRVNLENYMVGIDAGRPTATEQRIMDPGFANRPVSVHPYEHPSETSYRLSQQEARRRHEAARAEAREQAFDRAFMNRESAPRPDPAVKLEAKMTEQYSVVQRYNQSVKARARTLDAAKRQHGVINFGG